MPVEFVEHHLSHAVYGLLFAPQIPYRRSAPTSRAGVFNVIMDESEIESVFNLADGIGLSSYKFITNSTKNFVRVSKQNYNTY